jgi:hypothetical protein
VSADQGLSTSEERHRLAQLPSPISSTMCFTSICEPLRRNPPAM